MRRAHRPVPIAVPVDNTQAEFKLSDSGVFEQFGVVISKQGCVINRTANVSGVHAAVQSVATCTVAACNAPQQPLGTQTSAPGGSNAQQADLASCKSALGTSSESSTRDNCGSTSGTGNVLSSGNNSSAKTNSSSDSSSSGDGNSNQAGTIALEDLQELGVAGLGSSGLVKKVLHKPNGNVYVLKVINVNMGSEVVRRQVTTEIKALDGARHPHVVEYHQSYFVNGALTILMEYMDGGSLWDLLQKIRVIPQAYLPELARQVLLGLTHLHDTARICHRDIKPGNLLLSSSGQLKISDFGVSSQLSNSMSKCLSWVGTVTYMSPERIRGDSYGFNTDVWSLGLLLVECATGRYPYPPKHEAGEGAAVAGPRLGFWELLEYIVIEPAPKLPAGQFRRELVEFVGLCLQKNPSKRPSAAAMLQHPFITQAMCVNLADLLHPQHSKAYSTIAAQAAATAVKAGSTHRNQQTATITAVIPSATAAGCRVATSSSTVDVSRIEPYGTSTATSAGHFRASTIRKSSSARTGGGASQTAAFPAATGRRPVSAAPVIDAALAKKLAPYITTYQSLSAIGPSPGRQQQLQQQDCEHGVPVAQWEQQQHDRPIAGQAGYRQTLQQQSGEHLPQNTQQQSHQQNSQQQQQQRAKQPGLQLQQHMAAGPLRQSQLQRQSSLGQQRRTNKLAGQLAQHQQQHQLQRPQQAKAVGQQSTGVRGPLTSLKPTALPKRCVDDVGKATVKG